MDVSPDGKPGTNYFQANNPNVLQDLKAAYLKAFSPEKLAKKKLYADNPHLKNFDKYVLAKAPCQVILTAPAAREPPPRVVAAQAAAGGYPDSL